MKPSLGAGLSGASARRRITPASIVLAAASLSVGIVIAPLFTSGAGASSQPATVCPTVEPAPVMPVTQLEGTVEAAPSAPPALGQSIGTPRRGWLQDATRMPEGDGYHLRHPARAFATASTVQHLQSAIDRVRRKFRVHRLAVGDLSEEVGGLLSGHFSHQSGRDVDLGFYYRKRPFGYPHRFVRATRDNLHYKATWALIEALADTADEPGGVQYIVLDYRVQKLLYMHARRSGVDDETLDRIFQYPHGPGSDVGLLRHFPGHDNHFHVRFKCPPTDSYCREAADPNDGPTRKASKVALLGESAEP